jgi:NAD(P)-dependent dehydrogenase (short-subunit alcohol dehydrogenase family)
MDLELGGKAVVICGGARGIGFACAEAFAREGARVAIFDWNAELLAEAAAAIRKIGAEVLTQQVDVSNGEAVDAAHARVIETFGGIDVGFNNAGIGSPFRPIEETSEADWDKVIDVNLKGVWLCVRAQVRHMRPRNQGAIINTASNVAFVGSPGGVAYVASKHGIIGITRSVALELAKTRVRINAVAPGTVKTPLGKSRGAFVDPFPDAIIRKGLPIGRLGEPSEVADAVLWLASPRASLALGETLVIDGGFLAQ